MIKICGIYKITNLINGKVYIGSSLNINDRWYKHKRLLKNKKHNNIHLQSSYNKYGIENFKFIVEEECLETLLIERENYHINKNDSMNPNKGYNKRSADRHRVSEEEKRKRSESMRGEKHPLWGKHHSEKTKKIMSEIAKGSNNPNYGKITSDETKLKMSISMSGEKSPQAKLNWNIVNEIRQLWISQEWKQIQLAKKFNISRHAIGKIINNQYWIDKNYKIVKSKYYNKKLTFKDAENIRQKFLSKNYSRKQLSNEYVISHQMICDIINNVYWKEL